MVIVYNKKQNTRSPKLRDTVQHGTKKLQKTEYYNTII